MAKKLKQILKGLVPSTLMIHRLPRSNPNSILFTFDDGPHETLTPLVLDILDEYQVRAMFFVVGRCVYKNPHLLELIKSKGHYIGNHSYEHHNDTLPGFFAYREDILKCQNLVKSLIGSELCFFRPPRGVITPKTLLAARSCRLRSILWSIGCREWANSNDSPHTLARALLETLKPRDILLLHDDNPKVPRIWSLFSLSLNQEKSI
jgi:peptidoglycan/xylan/chitin deacetylase (PgdA/CDA1 family)